jgi:hypothetical protein
MKEELQSKLVEILSQMQEATAKASDFAVEQLPSVAQQYLTYGYTWAWVYFISIVLALCVCLFVTIKYGYLAKGTGFEERENITVITFVGSGMSLFTLLWVFIAVHSLILIHTAPKVWLLKEIARLVK